MNVWLVQRGKFKKDVSKITGIDSLVSFDCMGSAEFEFGALPQSLRRMTAELPNYSVTETDIKAHDGRALMLLRRSDQREDVLKVVSDLSTGKLRLKERSEMKEALAGKYDFGGGKPDTEFWWDIRNDWMAWLGKGKPVMKALKTLAQRWQKEAR